MASFWWRKEIYVQVTALGRWRRHYVRPRLRQIAPRNYAKQFRALHDDGLATAVEKEVPDGVPHREGAVQWTELADVVGEVEDRHRLVGGALRGGPEERGDRRGDADDGSHPA